MFTFNGQQLRGVMVEGEPWFAAKDACICIGLGGNNVHGHLSKLDADEKGVHTIHSLGGPQRTSIVSRPGLFKLIARSIKPEAKEFDRWVRHEVLPAVMDTGGYVMRDTIGLFDGPPCTTKGPEYYPCPLRADPQLF